jgi:hypothetical protein
MESQLVKTNTSKPTIQDNINKWVILDTQLKLANEKIKNFRNMKTELNHEICQYMKSKNLLQNKIEINGGELAIYEKKEYSSLTFGYIEKCLAEIISDKSQVDYIIHYLKEKRTVEMVLDIRRTAKNV